ncbi:hypothetical protein ACLUYE_07235 [Limosilactobacillus reuteri subsp. suis]|uniref:hypothetical protein n=1 Tax=Limosilactobacillus reuteri TaxID=1598 RepID=UPI003991BE08
MVQQDDKTKLDMPANIKKDVSIFTKALDSGNYSVSFYFEYSKNGKSDMSSFGYANATLDDETSKSMLQRFIFTFEESKVAKNQIEEFDLLKNNKDTFYYLDKDGLNNSKTLINNLESDKVIPSEDLSVLGNNLTKVRGAIAKVCFNNSDQTETYYLFVKVDNFNAFKKRKLSSGFMGNLTNDGVEKIDDNHLFFGIKNIIGFYYHNNTYIINTHSDFERMLFLSSEYFKTASKNIDKLGKNFTNIFKNVNEMKSSLKGKGSSILNRMMARISLDSLEERFSEKNKKETFREIDGIIKQQEFYNSFKNLNIDKENCTITYSDNSKFGFAALLSDRPAKTLLLKRAFME